jgi:transposase
MKKIINFRWGFMEFIKGTSRNQLFLFNECLDNLIEENNPVRIIDSYIEYLDLEELNFNLPRLETGASPYRSQLLLKIYIYGYNERIRSSRRLEKECKRNKEMIWLTEGLAPDFKTIADFRKNNRKGIRSVFKSFLQFCHKAGLLSLETIAIDGTKMRAQNSLNNIYQRNEIEKIEKRIEEKIEEYLLEIENEDKKETKDLEVNIDEVKNIVEKLKSLKKYKNKVEEIKTIFDNDKELKTYFGTDKDSRFQSDKGKVRAGYNPQIASDNKNKLIIANDVTNESNDQKQMTPMVNKVKEIKEELEIEVKTQAIMDTGYFSEVEIMNHKDDKTIEIIVSNKKEKAKNNKETGSVPANGFDINNFKYNREDDVFICPLGKKLKKTHTKPCIEKSGREVFEYQCYECNGCIKRVECTNNKRGRSITVSANKEYMDKFKESMRSKRNKKLIEKRKEIVEHPFGTIKSNLGYTYFVQRGLEKVRTEFSFICFIYNFKRVVNILGVKAFLDEIKRQKQLNK